MNRTLTNRTWSLALVAACSLGLAGSVVAQSGRVRRVEQPPPPPKTADPAPAGPVRRAPVPVNATFDVIYVAGSLAYAKDEKVTLTVREGTIGFVGKGSHLEVSANEITDISYGTTVRSRTAEGVAAGTVIPGLGGIIGNTKSVKHYLEIDWDGPPTQGAALRIDKDDYKAIIDALEKATGLQVKLEGAPLKKDIP
jgi:hypothetical protein